mgnify:CR=1 FL=1
MLTVLAASAAEVGVVFNALALALGSIWGRPTWGVWWTWDPRLTSTAVLLVIFAGYLALRSFTDEFERRARWSGVVGILGFLNVPVVYLMEVVDSGRKALPLDEGRWPEVQAHLMAQSVGAANLAAGLQDAYLACSPVIALTGRKIASVMSIGKQPPAAARCRRRFMIHRWV